MALFSLIFGIMTQIFISGLRFFTLHSMALEAQQQAMIAMKWLENDMRGASYQSLQVTDDGLIFGSRLGLNEQLAVEDGFLAWQKFICYYVDQSGEDSVLVRKQRAFDEVAFEPPEVPITITPDSFRSDSSEPRFVARYIESVTMTEGRPAKIKLKVDYGNGGFRMDLETDVSLHD